MDYKKINAPTNTVTRDVMTLADETGNIYESVAIIAKRANQISSEMKRELNQKLQEFATASDSTTRSCQRLLCWQRRNSWTIASITVLRSRAQISRRISDCYDSTYPDLVHTCSLCYGRCMYIFGGYR